MAAGTAGGGHYGAAAGGGSLRPRAATGHYGVGNLRHDRRGTHYATTSKGGSAEAGDGRGWSVAEREWENELLAAGGTTGHAARTAATGSYGGAVATNNGHWAGESNVQHAYGTHYAGTTTYAEKPLFHPPTAVNQHRHGTGCYNCGGWSGAGAVAAGVAVGAAVGVAAANTANANAAAAAYANGTIYAALPAGCAYTPFNGATYYNCGAAWFSPAYGANGVYYRVVPPP